jgi:hypothetical protein
MEYIAGTIIKSEEEDEYAAPGFYTDSGDYLAFTLLTATGESVNVWMPPSLYERENVEVGVGSFISAFMEPLYVFNNTFLMVDHSVLFHYEKYTESEEAYTEAIAILGKYAQISNQVETVLGSLYR